MRIHNAHLLENFGKNGKLNVAIVSDAYYPLVGGATVVAENMATALMEIANVVVIAPDGKYEDTSPYPVIRCTAKSLGSAIGNLAFPNLDCKFKKLIKSLPIDIVHCHTVFSLAKMFQKIARKRGVPFVLSGHSKFKEEYAGIVPTKLLQKIMVRRVVKFANRSSEIWPVSEGTKKHYESIGFTAPLWVSRNATELKFPENAELHISNAKKHFNFENKKNVLFFLSRLDNSTKNIDMILQACHILKKQNFEFFLILTGHGPDRKKLETLTEKLEIQDNVLFTGLVTGNLKMGLYLASDLFIFPSVVDTCGLVVLEAAAMQTPSVLVENSCPAELAKHNQNAFLCKLSAESLAEIIKLALSDKSLLRQVALNAQNDLGKDWTYAAQNALERYEFLIKNIKK